MIDLRESRITRGFKALNIADHAITKRQYISLKLIRFLSFHSRIEGLLCLFGLWWGFLTWSMPTFWWAWPLSKNFLSVTYGNPQIITYIVFATGLMGYIAIWKNWRRVRVISRLVAMCIWGLIALNHLVVVPPYSPGLACYSALFLAELLCYVNVLIQVETQVSSMISKSCHDR